MQTPTAAVPQIERIAQSPPARKAPPAGALLVVYTGTIFTSAFLLFLIQPMFGKMALPLLGGSPAIWNTCMLFFQATLLAGYLYAHVSTSLLGVRRQALVHMLVLVAAVLTLPVAIRAGWAEPSAGSPVAWLLALLTVSIGVPFFVLSSSGPLLQRWFASTGHRDAANPYFLYAASNLGSMLALLAYPFLLEPLLPLGAQSWTWSAGFAMLVLLTAGCAVLLWRTAPGQGAGAPTVSSADREPVSARRRLRWVALSFVPSSLLLGTTTYITTDIAAVPLLWILPLALYLLTFVLVFARTPRVSHPLMVKVQPFLVIPFVIMHFLGIPAGAVPVLLGHLILLFFVAAMICHRELADARPRAEGLTDYYLWMSVGGALGGVFNALVAPVVFDSIAEYGIALALACACRPVLTPARRVWDLGLPIALGAAAAAALVLIRQSTGAATGALGLGISLVLAVLLLSFADRPLRFGLGVAAVLLAGAVVNASRDGVLLRERTFFGVHQVSHHAASGEHRLSHGSTLHGSQKLDPALRTVPLTYYHPAGPAGDVFRGRQAAGVPQRMALVGLGTGALACYGRAGDELTFFEIDPVIERIARDPRYFTYLADCPADPRVVIGDARLTLRAERDAAFDLIVLDAFSSDAIPMHLVTREAMELYLRKLAVGGVVALHVSNRFLDLEPVVAAYQREAGVAAKILDYSPSEAETADGATRSIWIVLGRQAEDLAPITAGPRWRDLERRDGIRVWTDDYSNIVAVLRRR